jgi:hypothetical protein
MIIMEAVGLQIITCNKIKLSDQTAFRGVYRPAMIRSDLNFDRKLKVMGRS